MSEEMTITTEKINYVSNRRLKKYDQLIKQYIEKRDTRVVEVLPDTTKAEKDTIYLLKTKVDSETKYTLYVLNDEKFEALGGDIEEITEKEITDLFEEENTKNDTSTEAP